MRKPERSLTPKQKQFVAEYLIDLNATQAAIRAGYSQQNADKIGPELLGKTRIYVDQTLRELAQRTTMKADEVIDRLQRLASTDITDFLTWKGNTLMLKGPSEIPQELRQCIESVTQHETQQVKYLKLKLHPKVAALGMLAKYHNLFKRTIASKGLTVNIHVAAGPQAQKAPIVVNPKETCTKRLKPQKRPSHLHQERRTAAGQLRSLGGDQTERWEMLRPQNDAMLAGAGGGRTGGPSRRAAPLSSTIAGGHRTPLSDRAPRAELMQFGGCGEAAAGGAVARNLAFGPHRHDKAAPSKRRTPFF